MELTTIYRIQHPETQQGPYQSRVLRDLCECVDEDGDPLSIYYDGEDHDADCIAPGLLELSEELNNAHCDYAHPLAQDDGGVGASRALDNGWVCGFASMKDLREWFDGWIDEITDAGFEILEIQVPDDAIIYCHHQVIFDPSAVVHEIPV